MVLVHSFSEAKTGEGANFYSYSNIPFVPKLNFVQFVVNKNHNLAQVCFYLMVKMLNSYELKLRFY